MRLTEVFQKQRQSKTDAGVTITLDVKSVDENANTKLTATRVEKTAEENTNSNINTSATSDAHVEVKPSVNTVMSPNPKTETVKQAVADKQASKSYNISVTSFGPSTQLR